MKGVPMLRTNPFSLRFLAALLILAAALSLAGCGGPTNYERLFSNFDPDLKAQVLTEANLAREGGAWLAATGKFTSQGLIQQGVTENVIQMAIFDAGGEEAVYGVSHTVIEFEDGIVKVQDVRYTGNLDPETKESNGVAAIHAEVTCPTSSDNDGCKSTTMDYEDFWTAAWDGKRTIVGDLASPLIPNLWAFELKIK